MTLLRYILSLLFSISEQRSLFFEINTSVNNANKFCYSLLTVASRHCKLKDLRFLTERRADISVCYTKNNTAVHLVAVLYTVNNIKLKDLHFLTERRADISVCYTKNNTAVHLIAVLYTVNNIKLLLGKKVC